MEKELEVKILGLDVKLLEDKIIKLGATFIDEEYQENIIFSNPEKPLEGGSYLRIRKSESKKNPSKNYIETTLKKRINKESIRVNEEYTTRVENPEMLTEIYKAMGFTQISIGFKKRIKYTYSDITFDIDTWDEKTYPYPYMEIEVKREEDLKEVLSKLNIPMENVSTESIQTLKEKISQKSN